MNDAPILVLRGLTVEVMGKPVLREVDFELPQHGRVAVLGHNGAGKSTLLRAVMGLNAVRGGAIELEGAAITGAATAEVVRRGVSMVPQTAGYFPNLTVAENLDFGAVRDRGERLDEVLELFPVLAQRRSQMVGTMSGGERQMVAIGLALMANPRVLLLDEPSVGLAPTLVESVMASLARIHRELGVAIVLVEQNVPKAAEFADYAYVLNQGRVSVAGDPREVLSRDVWELA